MAKYHEGRWLERSPATSSGQAGGKNCFLPIDFVEKPQKKGEKMATLKQINEDSFKKNVLESELPVLVDFFADWCGPCQTMAPVLAELADQFEGRFKIVKVNIENSQQITEQYNISSIPTLIIFKNGQESRQVVGALPKTELESMMQAEL